MWLYSTIIFDLVPSVQDLAKPSHFHKFYELLLWGRGAFVCLYIHHVYQLMQNLIISPSTPSLHQGDLAISQPDLKILTYPGAPTTRPPALELCSDVTSNILSASGLPLMIPFFFHRSYFSHHSLVSLSFELAALPALGFFPPPQWRISGSSGSLEKSQARWAEAGWK